VDNVFSPIVNWIHANLPWLTITVVMHLLVLGTVAYLILLERKVASWVQDRIGPNRTGFGFGIIPILKDWRAFGLGQSFADGLKMLMKEDYRSPNTDRFLFSLAPVVMMIVVVISIAVIPWGGIVGQRRIGAEADITRYLESGHTVRHAVRLAIRDRAPYNRLLSEIRVYVNESPTPENIRQLPFTAMYNFDGTLRDGTPVVYQPGNRYYAVYVDGWRFQIANLNIGVLFILAVLSLAVYGVVIGGYASNNKYSFLGGLRATANMISYEIPLGLSVLCICILFGTLDLATIVERQAGYWFGVIPAWNVFAHPLAFVLFIICIHAEANRAPFDTAECEQELVGGYHTEYSSMRFGLFFLAEYAGMITTSAVCVALFLGGWHAPYLDKLWPALAGRVDNLADSVAITDNLLAAIFRAGVFFTKTILIVFLFMWTRWSLPRFRFDQIMSVAWKMLIPISLGLLVATALGVWFVYERGGKTLNGLGWQEAILFLAINIFVVGVALLMGSILPSGSETTNRRIAVTGSRFTRTPLPAALRAEQS
jgi:NADH-quinone oxidoreductase subunit H